MTSRKQQCFVARHASGAKAVDVIDQYNAVVDHDTDQQDATHHAHVVNADTSDEVCPNSTYSRKRDGENDRERHQDALEQERDEHVDEYDRQSHGDQTGGNFVVVVRHRRVVKRDALRQVDVFLGLINRTARLPLLA